jgi:hypothetical protein
MKPIFQTDVGPDSGNCVSACLASIFELRLEDVHISPKGMEGLVDFLGRYYLYPAKVRFENEFVPRGYSIGFFRIWELEEHYHAVVLFDGRVVHDPHPGSKGTASLGKPDHYVIFISYDPSTYLGREVI